MDNRYWIDLWISDKRSTLATMCNNLASDLLAGYNPAGNIIRRQIEDISAYRRDVEREADRLNLIDADEAGKWCRADLKRRGAIA